MLAPQMGFVKNDRVPTRVRPYEVRLGLTIGAYMYVGAGLVPALSLGAAWRRA